MSNIIEGFWDCKSCGTIGVRGGLRNCPHCGKPRGEDIEFYINANGRVLSDEEAALISENPDWLCSFCYSLNSDIANNCKSCGATKAGDEPDYFQNRRKQDEKEREIQEKEQEWLSITQDFSSGNNKKYSPIIRCLIAALCILATVFAVIAITKLFTPKIQEVIVDSISWQRNIAIEELKTFNESGWTLPNEARLQGTKNEIKKYNKEFSHYETKRKTITKRVLDYYKAETTTKNLGNGHFKTETRQVPVYKNVTETQTYQDPVYKNVPVYADKYYYEIDRWVVTRSVSAHGTDHNPVWGEVKLSKTEREGNRTEEYSLVVINKKDNIKTMILDYNTWSSIDIGQIIKVKVVMGNIVGLADE